MTDEFLAAVRQFFRAHPGLASFAAVDGDLARPDVNGVGGYDVDDGRRFRFETGEWVQEKPPSAEHLLQEDLASFLAATPGPAWGGRTVTVARSGRAPDEVVVSVDPLEGE